MFICKDSCELVSNQSANAWTKRLTSNHNDNDKDNNSSGDQNNHFCVLPPHLLADPVRSHAKISRVGTEIIGSIGNILGALTAVNE